MLLCVRGVWPSRNAEPTMTTPAPMVGVACRPISPLIEIDRLPGAVDRGGFQIDRAVLAERRDAHPGSGIQAPPAGSPA